MQNVKNREMDLTTGSIFKKLFIYALPFMFTNVLQIIFNATDIAVVGIMVGDDAVAAVGANTSLSSLLVNLFIALSIGSSVVLARNVGEKNLEKARQTVGTSIVLALISGFSLLLIGVPCAKLFLRLMSCDPEIIDMAVTYLRIYFLGMPIMMLYNFSASILRAVGDTKRPLIFLIIGGVANVVFNVLFILMGMTVEGVALGTILSQLIATILTVRVLIKNDGYGSLKKEYLKISKRELKEILAIGLPSAMQSLAFNVVNVIIQGKVNSFGKVGTSGNTVGQQFDSIIYNVGHAIAMSVMAFVGQNMGAKKIERVKQSIFSAIILSIIVVLIMGVLFGVFAYPLCAIISKSPEAVEYAVQRLSIMAFTYFLCTVMEVLGNSVRAMGRPVVSLIVSVMGASVFRTTMLEVLFAIIPSFSVIFWTYPASWVFTILMYVFVTPKVYKELKKKLNKKHEPETENNNQ